MNTSMRIGSLKNINSGSHSSNNVSQCPLTSRIQSFTKESTVRKQLKQCRDMDDIISLQLVNVNITATILNEFSKLLIRNGRTFTTMKFVQCDGDSLPALMAMIFDFSSTKTLVLSNGNGRNNAQEQLDESHNDSLFQAIHDGLKTNQSVTTLRMLGYTFSTTVFAWEGLSRNCTLKELDLSRCSFANEASIPSLANVLAKNHSVRALSLVESDFALPTSLAELMEHETAMNDVRDLDLSQTVLDCSLIQSLSKLLVNEHSNLRSLSLKNLQAPSIRFESESAMKDYRYRLNQAMNEAFASVAQNASLKQLDLSGNDLSTDFNNNLIATLCSSLNQSTRSTLRSLNLSDTNLALSSLDIVAHALPQLQTCLKSLSVFSEDTQDMEMTLACVDAFVNGLQQNYTLYSLGEGLVSDDEDEEDTEEEEWKSKIQHYLDWNRAGRKAIQVDDSLPLGIWSHVLEQCATTSSNNSSILFSMLRESPALLQH